MFSTFFLLLHIFLQHLITVFHFTLINKLNFLISCLINWTSVALLLPMDVPTAPNVNDLMHLMVISNFFIASSELSRLQENRFNVRVCHVLHHFLFFFQTNIYDVKNERKMRKFCSNLQTADKRDRKFFSRTNKKCNKISFKLEYLDYLNVESRMLHLNLELSRWLEKFRNTASSHYHHSSNIVEYGNFIADYKLH